MKKWILALLIFTGSSALAQDSNASAQSAPATVPPIAFDIEHEAHLIDIANRRFEAKFARQDANGLALEYTEDAVFLKPGLPPQYGREGVRRVMQSNFDAGLARIEFFQEELEFYPPYDTAFERARFKAYKAGESQPAAEASYIILWKKVGGEWLIHRDMFNLDK